MPDPEGTVRPFLTTHFLNLTFYLLMDTKTGDVGMDGDGSQSLNHRGQIAFQQKNGYRIRRYGLGNR